MLHQAQAKLELNVMLIVDKSSILQSMYITYCYILQNNKTLLLKIIKSSQQTISNISLFLGYLAVDSIC